jgi:hypothetical protein
MAVDMAQKYLTFAACILFLGFLSAQVSAATLSEADVRKAIIQQSLAGYPGPCPCPYNSMRNGRACGGRSAYSRPGGYSPVCYDKDVTPAMIRSYRANH